LSIYSRKKSKSALKNARAKAPYSAGESLVKPAAVKTTRIMCSNAVAQWFPNLGALPLRGNMRFFGG